jgi:integrase
MGVKVREKKPGEFWIFVNHAGQRTSRRVGPEDLAESVASEIRRRLLLGQDAFPSDEDPGAGPTVGEYFQRVKARWQASMSPKYFAGIEADYRLYILPELADVHVSAIDRDTLVEFVGVLRKTTVKSGRMMSKSYLARIVKALSILLTAAVEDKRMSLSANPCQRIGKYWKAQADYREEPDPFTAAEVPVLLAACREHFAFRDYCLLLTLIHTGVRVSEALGLQWRDLDLDTRVVRVRRQWQSGEHRTLKTPRSKRDVLLSSALADALRTLRPEEYAEQSPVFANGSGNPPDLDNWRTRVFVETCERAGIRPRRIHDCRHSYASLHLSAGQSLKWVSAQMGHSSIRVTADVYGHLEAGSNLAATDTLPGPVRTPAAPKKKARQRVGLKSL